MINKGLELAAVTRQPVIPVMPKQHHPKPFTHLRYRPVKSSVKFVFESLEFCNHPFANGLPKNNEFPICGLAANMCETKKIKRLWLTFASVPAVLGRKTPKLDNPRFATVKLQVEHPKTLYQIFVEPLSVFPVLKANHKVVAESNDNDLSASSTQLTFLVMIAA
jgi:hypothetical protein